jgi:amino acid permease
MRFFSKIAFISNLGFLAFIILGYVEINQKKAGIQDNLIPLPFVTGTLVVLGILALFINIIFCIFSVCYMLKKKQQFIPVWILAANFIILFVEVFYFFIL